MDFLVSTTGTGGTVVVPAPGQAAVTTTIPFTVDTTDYYGTINLAAIGLPTGASASFSTGSSITLANSTTSIPVTMTITVPAGTSTGSFNIQMSGTDVWNQPRTSGLYTLIVNPAEDFSLGSKPSVINMETTDFVRGNTLTATSTAFAGTVTVTQSGAPAGMTINLGGGTITMASGGSGGLAYTVATSGVPAGTYPITFTASGTNSDGPISRSTVVNILVEDYTLSFGTDPVVLLDTASASANTSVNVVGVGPGAFTDTVTIQSVTGAPANSGQSFTGTAMDTSTPGTISYFVGGTVVGGTYTITVTATSGNGVTHTFTFTLDVESITIAPRVVATTSTGIPVHVIVHGAVGGSTGTGTVDGTWLGGYTSNISLSDTGGGLYTFAFAPATLVSTGPTSSTMTVTVMPTGSSAGTYTNVDTLIGNSPPLGTTASVNLTVEDFTASTATNPVHTGPSQSANVTVDLTRLPAELPFDEDITLTVTDRTGTWSASPVLVTNPGTSGILTISATTAGPGVLYPVTITATSTSGVVHSFTLNIGI
jgi:hypothetical protein